MWMMGYNDGGDLNLPDSFHERKLRPLMPRPNINSSSTSATTTTTPCLSRAHGTDIFSQYHNLGVAEQSKMREYNNPPVVVSSRWNPTSEQLRALEELYRRGTRTPSTEQIQHITAQLRRYGKIEGKNVFYWFQNHKARERQKRRREMESAPSGMHHHDHDDHNKSDQRKDFGGSRAVFEVEQTRNWPPSTNCTSTLPEQEPVSMQRGAAAKAETVVAELLRSTDEGWNQLDEGELQYQRSDLVEKNDTWQMMNLSCLVHPHDYPSNSHHHYVSTTHQIKSPSPPLNTATTTTRGGRSSIRTNIARSSASAREMDSKFTKSHDLSFFIAPYSNCREDCGFEYFNYYNGFGNSYYVGEEDHEFMESQTLQLFPLKNCNDNQDIKDQKETDQISVSEMCASFSTGTPTQFIEFLPLKN